MFQSRLWKYPLLILLCCLPQAGTGQQIAGTKPKFPFQEKLNYRIEWRLITAGTATLELTNPGSNLWHTNLEIQSAGIMTRLYKVLDTYKATADPKFCGVSADLNDEEGKRHTQTRLTFDNGRRKVKYDQQDQVKNISKHSELDIPACAFEITGALTKIRTLNLEPGKSTNLPITDGKKLANARIEVQAKESINLDGKTYQTIRCEAFLFDNVLYRRKGRLLIWLTDDNDRIPVQMRLQMGFPIGSVSILLEKEGKL